MAKLTDAVVTTLKGYFDAGDQPTEAQFDALIDAIQQGIEEHNHDGTGDGDGVSNLVGPTGIGVAPTHMLTIKDDAGGDYAAKFWNDGGAINRHGILVQGGHTVPGTAGDTYYFTALDGSAGVTGRIKTVDGVFQLADVSDERRKTNIEDTKVKGLEVINSLRVRDYNWKDNPKGPLMTSFIAQEAREVFPDMIGEDPDGMLMTSRAMLIPIIVKAIQELYALQEK